MSIKSINYNMNSIITNKNNIQASTYLALTSVLAG